MKVAGIQRSLFLALAKIKETSSSWVPMTNGVSAPTLKRTDSRVGPVISLPSATGPKNDTGAGQPVQHFQGRDLRHHHLLLNRRQDFLGNGFKTRKGGFRAGRRGHRAGKLPGLLRSHICDHAVGTVNGAEQRMGAGLPSRVRPAPPPKPSNPSRLESTIVTAPSWAKEVPSGQGSPGTWRCIHAVVVDKHGQAGTGSGRGPKVVHVQRGGPFDGWIGNQGYPAVVPALCGGAHHQHIEHTLPRAVRHRGGKNAPGPEEVRQRECL